MNSEQLKNLQAPLKEKYREQPETAIITLKAEGRLGEGISCKVETEEQWLKQVCIPLPEAMECSLAPVIYYWKH